MPRTRISALVTEKALSLRNESGSHSIIDAYAEATEVGLKNVCAKVSVQLADDLARVTDQLGISKRLFVESAIVDAVAQAEAIIAEELEQEYWEERFQTDPEARDANVHAYRARKVGQ